MVAPPVPPRGHTGSAYSSNPQSANAAEHAAEVAAAAVAKAWPKSWNEVIFNPPVHRATSGAYIDPEDYNPKEPPATSGGSNFRSTVLGSDSAKVRRARKGVLFQHTANASEWNINGKDEDSGLGKNRYGFRFHYNPSTVDHGMGIGGTNINMSVVMSGAGQSMPITTDNMPTVTFQIFLNRIEDMMLISSPKSKSGEGTSGLYIPSVEDQNYIYGRQLSDADFRGIYNRGTGYDLEFLFRALLGRPWKTLLRGRTADVGIAFGVPMILDLSAGIAPGLVPHGQRYLGRVDSISYSHLSFNSRMVPMWTQVGITFVRYPDINYDPKYDTDATAADTSTYKANYSPNAGSYIGPDAVVYTGGTPTAGYEEVGYGTGQAVYTGGTPTYVKGYRE